MHIKLATLFGSATVLIIATSASADGPLALSDFQLDGVTPLAQYSPAELFQLRIAITSATDDDPDRSRDAIIQEELETENSGIESGDQSMPLAATTQNASSELTVAPEPTVASTSRNQAATWTGGKYGASSRRTAAPEPTKWEGGTYGASSQRSVAREPTNQRSMVPEPTRWKGGTSGASSPRIPAPRPTLASTNRNQPSAWAGRTQRTSTVSSSRSPSRARAVISVPSRAWRSENLSRPHATVRLANTEQSSLRGGPGGAAQRANIAPRVRGIMVNVRSQVTRVLRSLPNGNRGFSMRP
jgi:hypothetical protein